MSKLMSRANPLLWFVVPLRRGGKGLAFAKGLGFGKGLGFSRRLGFALATTGCFSYIATQKFREAIQVTGNHADVQSPNKLFLLRLMFGRARSRLLGRLLAVELPLGLRRFLRVCIFALKPQTLDEARFPIEAYSSLAQLFSRTLKDRCREIRDLSPFAMVSPCDCTVSSLGRVEGDRVPQVKGATYSLKAFLGSQPQRKNPNGKLMFIVLHLAPHQYHHFHAPCDFSQTLRRHMHGECLPVFRSFLAKFNDIFSVQERVVLTGSWRGGCFNMAAVAACNVGNIRLEKEPDLRTNQDRVVLRHLGGDVETRIFTDKPLEFQVGSHVGEFKLGSTVVLVFEAPEDFEFSVSVGERLQAGARLGGVGPTQAAKTEAERRYIHY